MPNFSRALFLAAAPLAALSVKRADAQTLPTVRVGAIPSDGFAEPFFGKDMGFFEKAGFNVEISEFGNGSAAAQAVAGGAIDVGIATVTALANAAIHGVPFLYIVGGSLYTTNAPAAVLSVPLNSPIKSAADLVGKTVAIAAFKDGTHLAMAAWLTKNNVDFSKVNFVEMAFPAMAPALQRGTVAAAVLVGPFIFAAADTTRVLAKPLDALAPEFLLSGWFATKAWLLANPQLAKKFVAAMIETAKWANANHAGSAKVLAKYTKMDEALLDKSIRAVYSERLVTPAELEPTLGWASRMKFIDRPVAGREIIASV